MNCETALVIITTPDPFPCNPPISLHFSFEISLLNNFHLLRLLCPPPRLLSLGMLGHLNFF